MKSQPSQHKNNTFNWLAIFADKQSLIWIVFTQVVVFVIWKFLYPDPLFTGDTGSYILSAINDTINGVRPIGYSWYLSLMHLVGGGSVGAVVIGQFLLYLVAITVFLLTWFHLLKIDSRVFKQGFIILMAVAPGILYLHNMAMSDSVFISYTMLWFVSLILYKETGNLVIGVIHVILLYLLIQTRYVGLVYPVASVVYLLYTMKGKGAIVSILSVLAVFWVVTTTQSEMKKVYGFNRFSAFGDWAQANNVSVVVPYVDMDKLDTKDPKVAYVHAIMKQFPDSVFSEYRILSTHFMWRNGWPGKTILSQVMAQNQGMNYTRAWIYTGELLGAWASAMKSAFFMDYVVHFALFNSSQVFFPQYGLGGYKTDSSPNQVAMQWYGVNSTSFSASFDFYGQWINPISKYFHLFWWLVFMGLSVMVFVRKKWSDWPVVHKQLVILSFVFGFIYIAGSVYGHPFHYRYFLPINFIFMGIIGWFTYELFFRTKSDGA